MTGELRPLPRYVQILGKRFVIKVPKKLPDEDTSTLGFTDGHISSIQILDSLDSRRKWQTLLHEVMHAILYMNGVSSAIEEDIEEIIVQSLEHGITQFIEQYGDRLVAALKDEE